MSLAITMKTKNNIQKTFSMRNFNLNLNKRNNITNRTLKTNSLIPSPFSSSLSSSFSTQFSHFFQNNKTEISFQKRPYCMLQLEPITSIDKFQKYQTEINLTLEPKVELEVSDPKVIFNNVWSKLEEKYSLSNLSFPKEIIWLMGAPGAGKGTNTPFIHKIRGLTTPPIVMSDLLTSPEAKETKKKAGLVGDGTVLELLLEKLLDEKNHTGVIVDGFPRTQVQVECLKLFHSALIQINKKFSGSYLSSKFPRPKFRVVVLYISEKESINRQLYRGTKVRENNEKFRISGEGVFMEERPTDFSEEAARMRYKIFTDHYGTLVSLREHFTFKIIQAGGTVEMVHRDLLDEFRYQGSLDLSEDTYRTISQLPMAIDSIAHARQNLIYRLDHYQSTDKFLFDSIIYLIQTEIYPIVFQHSHAGYAIYRTDSPIFRNQQARGMVVDILTERGFQVTSDAHTVVVPKSVNLTTGQINSESKTELIFYIHFDKSHLH